MLATPLLAALSKAYPNTQFDWGVADWARPALAGNPYLTELVPIDLEMRRDTLRELIEVIRRQRYDSCFVPNGSSLLAYIAWRARIPQRIGLGAGGRGFSHTLPVRLSSPVRHEAEKALAVARAMGVDTEAACSEFYPSDAERMAVTRWLVETLDWTGESPLVLIHPGGGDNPWHSHKEKQWPVERFVLLCNRLIRRYQARVVLVGREIDRPLTAAINGLMPVPIADTAGKVSLGWLGALAEVASLYVGNDSGLTHVIAAVGCPTIAIFGPSDPAVSGPYVAHKKVRMLWHEVQGGMFSWAGGVTVDEVLEAAGELL